MRRAVERVLSRPEYAEAEPGILERAIGAVAEQVGRVVQALAGTGLGSALGALLLLALLAAVGFVAWRWLRGVHRDPAVGERVEVTPARPAAEWLAEAERHERAGAWRQAVRCRYRAALARLAAAGVVEEAPGRTTREYLALVAGRAHEREALVVLTDRFERAWYGDVPVTEADVRAVRAAEASLRAGS